MNIKSRSNWLWTATVSGSLLMSACSQQAANQPVMTTTEEVSIYSSKSSEALSDSLILVQFYHETSGDGWWKKSGWLNDPLEHWRGVKVETINGEKRVVALRLGANNLKGTIPTILGQLSELRALDLKWNEGLHGSIPEELYNLTKLESLNLRMTNITGQLSPSIGNLVELDTLNLRTFTYEQGVYPYVRNTKLMTGELPKEIGQLTKMRFIDLGRQGFTGQIPAELGNCVALEEIDFDECDFTGELPENLKNLSRLHTLALSYNRLEGEIPAWIGDLKSLERIWLRYNHFTGNIPESITQLPKLSHISLYNNQLTGELPKGLGKMKSLRSLLLGDNQLEGDFMTALEPLLNGQLYGADLSYNNFTGQAPDPAQFRSPLDLKGNRLTGELPNYFIQKAGAMALVYPQQEGFGFDNISDEEAVKLLPAANDTSHLIHFPDPSEFKK